jgi:hypothetical protein
VAHGGFLILAVPPLVIAAMKWVLPNV